MGERAAETLSYTNNIADRRARYKIHIVSAVGCLCHGGGCRLSVAARSADGEPAVENKDVDCLKVAGAIFYLGV